MADDFYPDVLAETEEELQEGGEAGQDNVAELLRRVLDDNRAANEELIRRVAGTRQPQAGVPLQQDTPAPGLEFDMAGLPDPAVDPGAFHKAYLERANSAASKFAQGLEQRVAQRQQVQYTNQQAIDAANALIKTANPALSDEIIGMASQVVAKRIAADGRDPMTVLRQDTESVAQQILDYTDDMMRQLGGTPAQRHRESEDTGNRARGLLNGRQRAPAPRQQQRPTAPDPLAMVKELQKEQREKRIY